MSNRGNGEQVEQRASRVGLYTTIIVHLVVILFLLSYSFTNAVSKSSKFIIDFSQDKPTPEELEQLEELKKQVEDMKATADQLKEEAEKRKEENFQADVAAQLDKQIAEAPAARNVVRDANGSLKDDRHTDTRQLYKDARDLQKRLDATKRDAMRQNESSEDYAEQAAANAYQGSAASDAGYSGPSVLSYSLKGRKGRYLEVPAYKWYGAGDVTVIITVDRTGRVLSAKVDEAKSSKDRNLYDLAVAAAMNSEFTALGSAPNPETGSIVYRFIRQ
jgi:outer membrane biosynthesis protein TonB